MDPLEEELLLSGVWICYGMKIISEQLLDVKPIPEQWENVTSIIDVFPISALYLGETEQLAKSLQRAWKELKLNPEIDYSFHQL